MEVLNTIDGRADMLLSETCAIVIGLLVINVKSTTAHRDHAIFSAEVVRVVTVCDPQRLSYLDTPQRLSYLDTTDRKNVSVKHGCPRQYGKISKSYILTLPQPKGRVMQMTCEQTLDELTVHV